MDVETLDTSNELAEGTVQLTRAAANLERVAAAIEARLGCFSGEVPVVAAVVDAEPSARLTDLEARLQAIEEAMARQAGEIRAQASIPAPAAGRKTLAAGAAHLLAKHGLDTLEQVNGSTLDVALAGLSIEQRIAVKSQLLRAGMLS